MKKIMIMAYSFLLQGCITTQVSQDEIYRYKDKHIRDFLSDQIMYNIHNPNYNTFLHRGGSDRYFIYTPALFVDEQVKSPSLNIKRLCEVSGGQGITEKYNGEVSVESGERVQKAFNDMKLSSFLGMYNFFNSSCLNFKKQSVAYEKQARMLDEYINKDYFYNDFSCSVNGNIKWSLSIEPVLIDKDKSGVEQLWILMTIKS